MARAGFVVVVVVVALLLLTAIATADTVDPHFAALQRVGFDGSDNGLVINAGARLQPWLSTNVGIYTDRLVSGGAIGVFGTAHFESTDQLFVGIRLSAGANDAGQSFAAGEWADTAVRLGFRAVSDAARGSTWVDIASTSPRARLYWSGQLTLAPADWLDLAGRGTWIVDRDGARIAIDLSLSVIHRETALRITFGLLIGELPIWLGRGVPQGIEPGDGSIYVAVEVRG